MGARRFGESELITGALSGQRRLRPSTTPPRTPPRTPRSRSWPPPPGLCPNSRPSRLVVKLSDVRVLIDVKPTGEQLQILVDYRPGFALIRGAAGSGKTTTAVLRLRYVTGVWRRQRARSKSGDPFRVLVLTYNRTLRGYVQELVERQIAADGFDLTLSTFGHWAWDLLGQPDVLKDAPRAKKLWEFGSTLGYTRDFLMGEVDYVLGRFPRARLADYANPQARDTYERRGRGAVPRVERPQRQRLLDEVIGPYETWKEREGLIDWTDVAVRVAAGDVTTRYDIVVVDEAQDFSANQVRAVTRHLARRHSTTFVLDAVQRIYPHGFSWREVGIELTHSYRLLQNHRNTKQIAAFAQPLVEGLPIEDDGTLPDFETCDTEGILPAVVRGPYAAQMDWIIRFIQELPREESVALLHPRGGDWLNYTRRRLREKGLNYVEMTRRPEWPRGSEHIGLSTLHSAKGLEFDHIVVLGVNAELMPHGPDEDDTQLSMHRRVVAMAIGRARKTVTLSYKPEEASRVVELLDPGTYRAINVP